MPANNLKKSSFKKALGRQTRRVNDTQAKLNARQAEAEEEIESISGQAPASISGTQTRSRSPSLSLSDIESGGNANSEDRRSPQKRTLETKFPNLKKKVDTKGKKKAAEEKRLWAHHLKMKNEDTQRMLVDLRRDKRDGEPIVKSFFRTSNKNYLSFDNLEGETDQGNSFCTPKIFFTQYYKDKNLVKEGASDPWRDITIGFAPYEAGQVVKALNCMAADNPAIDFCMEEEDDE